MAFQSLVFGALLFFATYPGQSQPSIDYHQHLRSPSAAKRGSLPNPFSARDLISLWTRLNRLRKNSALYQGTTLVVP
jgi:hypothetical protein